MNTYRASNGRKSAQFLAVMKMPRLQNELEIVLVETTTLSTKSIYKEFSKPTSRSVMILPFLATTKASFWKDGKKRLLPSIQI